MLTPQFHTTGPHSFSRQFVHDAHGQFDTRIALGNGDRQAILETQ